MSKNKSLGSSPIAFDASKSSMEFIPDRGISRQKKKKASTVSKATIPTKKESTPTTTLTKQQKEKKSKKKVVSYNLEVDLVQQVKIIANNKGMYYSSLVSSALKEWISNHVQIPLHKDSRN